MKFLTYWKLKTMLPVLLACTAAILGSLVWRDSLTRVYSKEEEKCREILSARLVTAQKILGKTRMISQWETIQEVIEDLAEFPDFSSVTLFDPANITIASVGITEWKENKITEPPSLFSKIIARVRTTQNSEIIVSDDRKMIYGFAPVTYQDNNGAQAPSAMGILFVQMDLENPKQVARSIVNRQFILTAWVIGGLAVLSGIVLHVALDQKIARFVNITQQFESGDFEARTGENGNDEISHLGQSFDQMAAKIAEDQNLLKENEERYRTILDMLVEGIVTIDSRGIIESINESGIRMFGYEPGELTGKNVSILMPSPFKEEHDSYIANYLETGQARIIGIGREVIGQRKDGTTFPCYLSVSDAQIRHKHLFTGMISDLTERKRLELERLQSERLASIGAMSAKLAHEIRNPLSSVLLNLDLMQDELNAHRGTEHESSEEAKALLKSIDSQIRRIHCVTEDYMQLAKVPKVKRERTNINETINHGLICMLTYFQAAHVKLKTSFDSTVPEILADEGPLWQAVLNIIKNAVEAMPDGGTLTMATTMGKNEIILKISDTGKGIETNHMDQILKPFFSTKSHGTGLGLTIAQQIVTEHGGSIKCETNVGQGTTFTIHLPLGVG